MRDLTSQGQSPVLNKLISPISNGEKQKETYSGTVPHFQEQRSSTNLQVHFLGPNLRVIIFYLFPIPYIYVMHSDHVPLQYSVPPQQPLISYKV